MKYNEWSNGDFKTKAIQVMANVSRSFYRDREKEKNQMMESSFDIISVVGPENDRQYPVNSGKKKTENVEEGDVENVEKKRANDVT